MQSCPEDTGRNWSRGKPSDGGLSARASDGLNSFRCFDMWEIYTGDLGSQPYIALHDGHIITYIYISAVRTVS